MISAFLFVVEQEESYKVVSAWEKFGGSFTKGLAQALMHADPENVHKIHETFEKEWDEAVKQYDSYIKKGEK